ncbi:CBS domain-containing protein [Kineococcus terrestris]|uniref:CBS domain-containing protein n=1 Tax=Kineococcus terrestris TaxID=2044856 RepID=UPI0034DB71D5
MLVREAMRTPVVTVQEDDHVAHAARVLLHHGISSVPVLDGEGHLVGIVSESDLLRDRVGRDPRAHLSSREDVAEEGAPPPRLVAEVMTTRPLTVDAAGDLADATELMLDRSVKAVPVLDGRRLVGVLARRDVLRTVAHADDDVRDAVLARLADDLPGTSWTVEVEDGVVTLDGPAEASQHRIAAVLARTVPGVVRVSTTDEHVSYDQPVPRARP